MFSKYTKMTGDIVTLKETSRNDLHYYEVSMSENREKFHLDYCCSYVYAKKWVKFLESGYYVDSVKTNRFRVLEHDNLDYIKSVVAKHPERQVFYTWQANDDCEAMWKQYTGVE